MYQDSGSVAEQGFTNRVEIPQTIRDSLVDGCWQLYYIKY